MADSNIRIKVDADTKGAVRPLDDLAEAAGDASTAVETLDGAKVAVDTTEAKRDIDGLLAKVDALTGSRGTQAILLGTNADEIVREIVNLVDEVDKLDASDPEIDVKVGAIRDLESDLERINGKIREIDGTPVTLDTTSARRNVDDLGASAGSSKSVLANMVGNTVQDLGALGGVAGSAGVAIGQMGEYMADAASSGDKFSDILKNFGTVAAPLAGLAAITFAIGEWQKQMAKAKQEAEDLLKAQQGLRQGDTAAWVTELTTQYGSLIESLGAAGVSMTEFRAIVEQGPEAVDALKQRLDDAGVSTLLLGDGALTAGGQLDQLATQFGKNEATLDAQDRVTREVADAYGLMVDASGNLVPAQEAAAAATQVVVDVLQAQLDAQQAVVDAQRAAADSQFALTAAEDAWLDAADGYEQSMVDIAAAGGTAEQVARNQAVATNGATQEAIKMADAAVRVADEQAKANGTTLSAADSTRTWASRMIDAASNASGPLRQSILDYTASVLGIPPEVISDVSADLDEGSVNTAKTAIIDAAQDQDSLITTEEQGAARAGREIDEASRPRDAVINVRTSGLGAVIDSLAGLLGKRSLTEPASGNRSVALTVQGNIYGDRALNERLADWERSIVQAINAGPR